MTVYRLPKFCTEVWTPQFPGAPLTADPVTGDLSPRNNAEETYLQSIGAVPAPNTPGGGSAVWGGITGTLSSQSDLNTRFTTNETNISNNSSAITALQNAQNVQTDNAQTGTTYTFVLADAGKNVDLNNASAITVTIPQDSSVLFPVGTLLYWTQVGAGTVTVAPDTGVTLTKPSARSLSTSAQYEGGYAYKVASNSWRVYNN